MAGSKYAFEHCLTLPMYFEVTDQEQDFVVETLISFVFQKREKNLRFLMSHIHRQTLCDLA